MNDTSRLPQLYGLVTVAALGVTGIGAHDRFTWLLEVGWVILAIPLLVVTWRAFPLTPLLLSLLFVHGLILIVGGYYTYARVPAGDWVKAWLHLDRNPYDRLGHLAQGFVPAILARELLLRTSPLVPGKWLSFLVVCVCMAFSACYELIEWQAAVLFGSASTDFLGSQGDPWDTQKDMFCCLIGSITSVLLLSSLHDRQLRERGYFPARTTDQPCTNPTSP